MSLYQMNADKAILNKYIEESEHKPERELSPNEKAFVDMLHTQMDDGFRLGRTIRAYMVLIRHLDEDYNDIITNLYYASNSIDKHSGLARRLIGALEHMKPDKRTIEALNRFSKKYRQRQAWLRQTSINAAIDLTPVADYIELVGEDRFEIELRIVTGTKDDEAMQRLIFKMMDELKKIGMENAYKERLDKYRKRSSEVRAITDHDKASAKAKKAEQDRNDCEMLTFKCLNKMHECMEVLKDCSDIGFRLQSYCRKRDACTEPSCVVVVGKIVGNRFLFRYVSYPSGGNEYRLSESVGSARVFTEPESEEYVKAYLESHLSQYATAVRIV